MSKESFPKQEQVVTKAQVIEAYKKFIDKGIKNPDALDLEDPAVFRANEMFYKWCEQLDEAAKGNTEAESRANLEKTMFYVDAGFTDLDYLDEILHEWLPTDLKESPFKKNNPEREKTHKMIKDAMKQIEDMVQSQKK